MTVKTPRMAANASQVRYGKPHIRTDNSSGASRSRRQRIFSWVRQTRDQTTSTEQPAMLSSQANTVVGQTIPAITAAKPNTQDASTAAAGTPLVTLPRTRGPWPR